MLCNYHLVLENKTRNMDIFCKRYHKKLILLYELSNLFPKFHQIHQNANAREEKNNTSKLWQVNFNNFKKQIELLTLSKDKMITCQTLKNWTHSNFPWKFHFVNQKCSSHYIYLTEFLMILIDLKRKESRTKSYYQERRTFIFISMKTSLRMLSGLKRSLS